MQNLQQRSFSGSPSCMHSNPLCIITSSAALTIAIPARACADAATTLAVLMRALFATVIYCEFSNLTQHGSEASSCKCFGANQANSASNVTESKGKQLCTSSKAWDSHSRYMYMALRFIRSTATKRVNEKTSYWWQCRKLRNSGANFVVCCLKADVQMHQDRAPGSSNSHSTISISSWKLWYLAMFLNTVRRFRKTSAGSVHFSSPPHILHCLARCPDAT